jgi:hypothetical protein
MTLSSTGAKAAAALLGMMAMVNCGSPKLASDLAAQEQRDTALDAKPFSEVCTEVALGRAYGSTPEQKERATNTLAALWTRAKALGLSGGAMPDQNACNSMLELWKGRRLDLARVGKIDTIIVAKLFGVAELDLSGNALTDSDLVFFHNVGGGTYTKIHEHLKSFVLANNQITGTTPGVMHWKTRFNKLQRLDLSRNQMTTVANLGLPDTIISVSLAGNPELQIDSFMSSEDDSWKFATSLASLDLSGIKRLTFSALYLSGPRSASSIKLSDIRSVVKGAPECVDGTFGNLLYLSLARATVDGAIVDEMTKSIDCFPKAQIIELAGSSQAGAQSRVNDRHPQPTLDTAATCSSGLKAETDGKGRIARLHCEGQLKFAALGLDEGNVTAALSAEYPVFPLSR